MKDPMAPEMTHRLTVFSKKVGRGINRFNMIEEGDRILIGVSGGKDSLSLCTALTARKKWVPISYHCSAVLVDWKEYPLSQSQKDDLRRYFDRLEMPFETLPAEHSSKSSSKPFNCYICSRSRKKILFDHAQQFGIRKIALGHHMDDIVETTLLNILFRGEISTMMPVQTFFDGKFTIIRPMCEVDEREILRFVRQYPLPVVSIGCPHRDNTQRTHLKEMLRRLGKINTKVKENIYRAPWNINRDYLPDSLQRLKGSG